MCEYMPECVHMCVSYVLGSDEEWSCCYPLLLLLHAPSPAAILPIEKRGKAWMRRQEIQIEALAIEEAERKGREAGEPLDTSAGVCTTRMRWL